LFTEADMMMARCFENGFHLVDRCRRDLPALAGHFPEESAMRAALEELLGAASKIDDLLRRSNEPGAAHRSEQP
jgi:hypothetical protein